MLMQRMFTAAVFSLAVCLGKKAVCESAWTSNHTSRRTWESWPSLKCCDEARDGLIFLQNGLRDVPLQADLITIAALPRRRKDHIRFVSCSYNYQWHISTTLCAQPTPKCPFFLSYLNVIMYLYTLKYKELHSELYQHQIYSHSLESFLFLHGKHCRVLLCSLNRITLTGCTMGKAGAAR